MIATWTFGILLVLTPGIIDWSAGWWHVKLAAVLLLSGLHGVLSRWRRDFLADRNRRPQRFYRIANEVPTAAAGRDRDHGDRAAVLTASSHSNLLTFRRARPNWPVDGGWPIRLASGLPPSGRRATAARILPPDGTEPGHRSTMVGNDIPGIPPPSRIINRTLRPCISPN